MKKLLSVLLILSMALSLCACDELHEIIDSLPATPEESAEPSAVPEPTSEPAPEPTEEPAAAENDRVTVYFDKNEYIEKAPDDENQTILTFSYTTPTVFTENEAESEAVDKINEALSLYDELYYTGSGEGSGLNNMLEMALDTYSYSKGAGVYVNCELSSTRTVSVARADADVIGFLYSTYLYTGGAHGIAGNTGKNFDMEIGEELTLENLSAEPEEFRSFIAEKLIEIAKETPAGDENRQTQGTLYDEINSFTSDADASLTALVRDEAWVLDCEGITFYSTVYELLSYASGIQTFTVPYSELEGRLNEKYLPKQRSGDGSMSVARAADVQDGTVWSIDRIKVDDGGEELFLIVEGRIYDVNIYTVEYADYGQHFFETGRNWYTSYMEDCAVQAVTVIPEGMPHLMISYKDSNNVTFRWLVSESGLDGSVTLVDDSIVAVG